VVRAWATTLSVGGSNLFWEPGETFPAVGLVLFVLILFFRQVGEKLLVKFPEHPKPPQNPPASFASETVVQVQLGPQDKLRVPRVEVRDEIIPGKVSPSPALGKAGKGKCRRGVLVRKSAFVTNLLAVKLLVGKCSTG
jgi:hypothetical protein